MKKFNLAFAIAVAQLFKRIGGTFCSCSSLTAALFVLVLGGPGAAASEHSRIMPISTYDDDPFVDESEVEKIISANFYLGKDSRPLLANSMIKIEDEAEIYRLDLVKGFLPFANNPWPCAPKPDDPSFCLPLESNDKGNFRFPREERFPLHLIERGPDGRPLLDPNGLQIWKPRDLHLGATTAFEAAHAAKNAAEEWSGRILPWGSNGQLTINSHAFIDFNAFFSPSVRGLFFGVVPYRLAPGAPIQMFEMATSWEVAAHEAGHALHAELKPNRDVTDLGYRTWGESFGDQIEMWVSLREPERSRGFLRDTGGNLNGANAVTRLGEVLGALIGDENLSLRDAFHDKKVSTTSPEQHDRSEVLTGAAYRFFLVVYDDTKRRGAGPRVLEEAADILGTFLTRAADYLPENTMTLKDVAKGYLKVDKEFFGERYRTFLISEFMGREIFDAHSLSEWLAHEAALPSLRLPPRATDEDIDALVQSSLNQLGIGPDLGLDLQSVIRDKRRGQTIVRVELTLGRGPGALPLGNHGVLVFRANGTLADYHGPLPPGLFVNVQALVALAEQMGLDRRGAPLSIARRADGEFTVEARVMRGQDMKPYVEAFTLENPYGERREIIPSVYGGATKAARLKNAGMILSVEELMQ